MTTPSRWPRFRRLVFRLSTRRKMALAPSLSRSLPDLLNREASVRSPDASVAAAISATECGDTWPPVCVSCGFCCCCSWRVASAAGRCGCSPFCDDCCSTVFTISSTRDHRLDSLWNIQFSLNAHSPSESESSIYNTHIHTLRWNFFLSIFWFSDTSLVMNVAWIYSVIIVIIIIVTEYIWWR